MEKGDGQMNMIRENLFPLLAFGAGIGAARLGLAPVERGGMIVLCLLVFLVGLSVGGTPGILALMKKMKGRIFLIPLGVILGTAAGNIMAALLFSGISLREALLGGAGYGYYSLSAILITEQGEPVLGAMALVSNMMRELVTLAGAGLMARFLTPLGPIMAGGATSMDVTLPAVTRFSGSEYAPLSFVSGLLLSIAVPFMIALISMILP
ncbi:MAG TPA: lysine exporter LysO family protein [Candidatus Mcinerneyibacteriales bacterium]|nr:lysine exporter LysO family protein [Candidatus Mcinerneyibacteriales bacterium]